MKTLVLCAIITSSALFSQKIEDYKNIIIPIKFEDVKMNDYNLASILTNGLKTKKYAVYTESSPDIAQINRCNSLVAEVKDAGNILRNRIDLDFIDCNGKKIYTVRGVSMIKESEEGLQDALKLALNKIMISTPKSITPESNTVAQEPASSESKTLKPEVVYSLGKTVFRKITIAGNKKFTLISDDKNVTYAVFAPSSKSDVFHVKLGDNQQAIGYYEGENLVIDIPQEGGFQKVILLKR